jgi:hypothetical protein
MQIAKQYVERYVQEHPQFAGSARVDMWTAALGIGGWKTAYIFYVKGGKVARPRTKRMKASGICRVCGQVYLDPVLDDAHGPDPEAGKEIGNGMRFADIANVRDVCPACIAEHDLKLGCVDLLNLPKEAFTRNHPMAVLREPSLIIDALGNEVVVREVVKGGTK